MPSDSFKQYFDFQDLLSGVTSVSVKWLYFGSLALKRDTPLESAAG